MEPDTFEIQGPDENGHVFICSKDNPEAWCRNLGNWEEAAEVMSQWLGSVEYEPRS